MTAARTRCLLIGSNNSFINLTVPPNLLKIVPSFTACVQRLAAFWPHREENGTSVPPPSRESQPLPLCCRSSALLELRCPPMSRYVGFRSRCAQMCAQAASAGSAVPSGIQQKPEPSWLLPGVCDQSRPLPSLPECVPLRPRKR